jgi:hypothetical protein
MYLELSKSVSIGKAILSLTNGAGHTFLMNPSLSPINLHKNTSIGSYEILHPEHIMCSLDTLSAISTEELQSLSPQASGEPQLFTYINNAEHLSQIDSLISRFRYVFCNSPVELRRMHLVQHTITTNKSHPIRQRAY